MSESQISVDELRSSVRDVLHKQFGDEQRRSMADGLRQVRTSLHVAAAGLGWFGLSIPERYGGLGLELAHCAALYEELGAALAPLPVMTGALVAQIVLRSAAEDQKERFLPALAAGELVGTLDGGMVPNFRIETRRGERLLFGQTKTLIEGKGATLVLLRAAAAGEEERWVLLDASSRRLNLQDVGSIDRTRSFGGFAADGVLLRDEELLAVSADEVDALISHACVALACDAIGGAAAIFELTLEYLKTRRQFDRPIGSFQALKHRCANHRIRIDISRALLNRAIGQAPSGAGLSLIFVAKAICCDAYAQVAADCMQLHGGIGFTWEHPCHLYLRRAKLNQHLFGSAAECLDRSVASSRIAQVSGAIV